MTTIHFMITRILKLLNTAIWKQNILENDNDSSYDSHQMAIEPVNYEDCQP